MRIPTPVKIDFCNSSIVFFVFRTSNIQSQTHKSLDKKNLDEIMSEKLFLAQSNRKAFKMWSRSQFEIKSTEAWNPKSPFLRPQERPDRPRVRQDVKVEPARPRGPGMRLQVRWLLYVSNSMWYKHD